MLNDTFTASLAVLAGGAGRRMGQTKAQLRVEGEPILKRLVERVRWGGPTILVSAPGRELPAEAGLFSMVVRDAVADEGPLRGVLTALENVTTEELVVVPVDMPELTGEVLEWLLAQLSSRPEAEVVMVERESVRGKRLEPLPLACRVVPMRARVRGLLDQGERALMSLTREGAAIVPAPAEWPEKVWTNLNYPKDLTAYQGPPTVEGRSDETSHSS